MWCSEDNCSEYEAANARELPSTVARAVQRFAIFMEDLGEPCSRHFLPTLLSTALFGGMVWGLNWYLSSAALSPVSGKP